MRWHHVRPVVSSQFRFGASAEDVAAERARVATEGAGATLLRPTAMERCAARNRGWNPTMHVLMLLRGMGLDQPSNFVIIWPETSVRRKLRP